MNEHLESLSSAVRFLLSEKENIQNIERLKQEIKTTTEPFVWATVDLSKLSDRLPSHIKSGWIFVLKQGTPSESHFHPNSVQHMAMIEGKARSNIGGTWKDITLFSNSNDPKDQWVVIAEGVPHEFFPEEMDMVVISFHTCKEEELIEISADSGHQRRYEGTPQ